MFKCRTDLIQWHAPSSSGHDLHAPPDTTQHTGVDNHTTRRASAPAHDLTSLEFDKLAKIQGTYKLVGYISRKSHLPDSVYLAYLDFPNNLT